MFVCIKFSQTWKKIFEQPRTFIYLSLYEDILYGEWDYQHCREYHVIDKSV